jgi:hypothetical protein
MFGTEMVIASFALSIVPLIIICLTITNCIQLKENENNDVDSDDVKCCEQDDGDGDGDDGEGDDGEGDDGDDGEGDDELTIIGVSGCKRSGKDTIGKYLVNNHGFVRIAFADSLKDACKIIFGFSDEQVHGDEAKEVVDEYWKHAPREILQKVGTELFRDTLPLVCQNISKDVWIRSVDRKIKNLQKLGHNKFVITDLRFPNEAQFIKQNGGTIWKVSRDIIKNNQTDHQSEALIDDLPYDHLFDNSRTIDDLFEKVENMMRVD